MFDSIYLYAFKLRQYFNSGSQNLNYNSKAKLVKNGHSVMALLEFEPEPPTLDDAISKSEPKIRKKSIF